MESVKGNKSIEQQIRDILERMEVANAQEFTSGDLVELANILSDKIALEQRCKELTNEEVFCANCKNSGFFGTRGTNSTEPEAKNVNPSDLICVVSKTVDLVSGSVRTYLSCYPARQEGMPCGPEGRLYEKYEPRQK